jgi:membrane protein DedA with SNARE-associated domain
MTGSPNLSRRAAPVARFVPLAARSRSGEMLVFEWISDAVERMGYAGVALFMFLENIFPPIPSEVIMPVAGFVAARGGMDFWLAVVVGSLASLVGAVVWYVVGRRIGERRLRAWVGAHGRWLALSVEDVDRAQEWFRRRGTAAVLIGRLVPAVRTFVSLPAGFARMSFARFLLLSAVGTFLWALALAWAGNVLEANYDRVEKFLSPATWIVLGAILVAYVWRVARWRRRAGREPAASTPTP